MFEGKLIAILNLGRTRANGCSYDLPADLFAADETRPVRTKKKSAPNAVDNSNDAANKKRSVSNAGLDVRCKRLNKTKRSRSVCCS